MLRASSTIVPLLVAGLLAAALPLTAQQQVAPLIREERRATAGVKNRTADPSDGQVLGGATPTPTPEPTPNPEFVYVAIVNNHTLTRATLDRLMAGRVRDPQTAALLGMSSTPTTTRVDQPTVVGAEPDDALTALALQREAKMALRREEEDIVRGWVEHKTLADEARRQGLLISEAELAQRLAEINSQFDLRDDSVDRMLSAMGLTRSELEASIHEALLIERLLDRWIEVNMGEDHFRRVWQKTPQYFVTPPSYRIAHFSISLPDAGSLSSNAATRRDYLRSVRRQAADVRSRLAKGEDPQKLFDEVSERDMGVWGTVTATSLQADSLPPAVRAQVLELKQGQTSDVFESLVLDENNQPVPESVHVVKLVELIPATGDTFESALPRMRLLARDGARTSLLEQIRAAKSHTRISNLGGIPAHKLPDAMAMRATRPGIDLKRNLGSPASSPKS